MQPRKLPTEDNVVMCDQAIRGARVFRVDRAMDNVQNDFPDLIEPISGR